MKRLTAATLVGAVAVLVTASSSQAQYVFLGGGATIPMSEYKDFAKTGWMATAGVGTDIGDKGLWVEAQGYYGSNKHKAPATDEKTDLLGGFGAVGYSFMPGKSVRPWVMGGVGFLSHRFKDSTTPANNESESSFAWEAGAGLGFKAGAKANIWVGGQYMSGTSNISGTKFLALLAGVTINFGN
jgi:hypothetical protein